MLICRVAEDPALSEEIGASSIQEILGNLNNLRHYRFEEHPMLLMFSRGFKDIITKTAKFKEFPGLENKFPNSRGFKEIKDTWEPCHRDL